MYPIVSCAGVGLYPKMLSGIESNAWARRCWNVIVRCFMTAVIGFDGGCWALSVMGKATAASMARENLMRSLSLRMVVAYRAVAATCRPALRLRGVQQRPRVPQQNLLARRPPRERPARSERGLASSGDDQGPECPKAPDQHDMAGQQDRHPERREEAQRHALKPDHRGRISQRPTRCRAHDQDEVQKPKPVPAYVPGPPTRAAGRSPGEEQKHEGADERIAPARRDPDRSRQVTAADEHEEVPSNEEAGDMKAKQPSQIEILQPGVQSPLLTRQDDQDDRETGQDELGRGRPEPLQAPGLSERETDRKP